MLIPRFRIRTLMIAVTVVACAFAIDWRPRKRKLYRLACDVVRVNGRVAEVNQGNGLVKVTVGSDDSLGPGQVLNVFRAHPRLERLGQLWVVSVHPDGGIAMLVTSAAIRPKPVVAGDLVSIGWPPAPTLSVAQ